jgi:hypothetical protein
MQANGFWAGNEQLLPNPEKEGLPTIRPPRVMYHLALRNSKYPTTNAGMANNPRASYKPPRS